MDLMIKVILEQFPRWQTMYQLSLLALSIIGFFWIRRFLTTFQASDDPSQQPPTQGELIYVDEGPQIKPFFNQHFRVLGKPDAIYQSGGNITAVEYKSRKASVHNSDIVQAMTAALAARGEHYRVTHVLVITKRDRKSIALPKSDNALFELIKQPVYLVRQIKQGEVGEPSPSKSKCASCAHYTACKQTD
jgi:CRISPR/Cas system-associated exonuclease Cas4 (RecB family)